MISFLELLEENQQKTYKKLGGAVGKVAASAIPIPGSSIVVGPATAKVGEVVGGFIPKMEDSKLVKNIEKAYSAGGDNNTSLNLGKQKDAMDARSELLRKKGVGKIGRNIAKIDPILTGTMLNLKNR